MMRVLESMTTNTNTLDAEGAEAQRKDFRFLRDLCVSASSAMKEVCRVAIADIWVTEAQ